MTALTPRENEIATMMAKGLDHPAIARRLNVATSTIHKHMERIAEKLGLHKMKMEHGRADATMFVAAYGTTQSLAGVCEFLRRTRV